MHITDRTANNPKIYILCLPEKNCDTKNHSFFVQSGISGYSLFTNAIRKNAFHFVNNVVSLSNNKQILFLIRVQFDEIAEKQDDVVARSVHKIDINGVYYDF